MSTVLIVGKDTNLKSIMSNLETQISSIHGSQVTFSSYSPFFGSKTLIYTIKAENAHYCSTVIVRDYRNEDEPQLKSKGIEVYFRPDYSDPYKDRMIFEAIKGYFSLSNGLSQ
jgi:hypothetical protein